MALRRGVVQRAAAVRPVRPVGKEPRTALRRRGRSGPWGGVAVRRCGAAAGGLSGPLGGSVQRAAAVKLVRSVGQGAPAWRCGGAWFSVPQP
ncbi:hypothetical protein GCM10010501_59410 [Streptomyces libani subsp. rufus]|nr:hypothetical protein GCM10010501_59410 [Streptomyces libani subsp. rufus]